MNRKYIILFIGVIILFIIFIGVLFLQQNPVSTPLSLHKQNPASLQRTNQNRGSTPYVTLAPLASDPKEAARQFYLYYFATPENPLARGQYKSNPYLSPEFKDLLDVGYNNGNSPVFCPQNKRSNITVGQEIQVYTNYQYMTKETISEATSGGKDLYTILLKNDNGKWLVEDVNCLY